MQAIQCSSAISLMQTKMCYQIQFSKSRLLGVELRRHQVLSFIIHAIRLVIHHSRHRITLFILHVIMTSLLNRMGGMFSLEHVYSIWMDYWCYVRYASITCFYRYTNNLSGLHLSPNTQWKKYNYTVQYVTQYLRKTAVILKINVTSAQVKQQKEMETTKI